MPFLSFCLDFYSSRPSSNPDFTLMLSFVLSNLCWNDLFEKYLMSTYSLLGAYIIVNKSKICVFFCTMLWIYKIDNSVTYLFSSFYSKFSIWLYLNTCVYIYINTYYYFVKRMKAFYTYVLKNFYASKHLVTYLFLTNACGLRVYWIVSVNYSRDGQE